MKILYITQYFHPEICAPTNRAMANVVHLAQKGHIVDVVTEIPNHPKGIVFQDFRNRILKKKCYENFSVAHVWVWTGRKKNFLTRILFYSSFMFFASVYSILRWKKYDIVYVTSPPLFVGVIGLILQKLFPKSKYVFEVRDLWPDVAVEMGEISSRLLIDISKKIEIKAYKNYDKIISLTEFFKKHISEHTDKEKIEVVRNGSDIREFNKALVPEEIKISVQNNRFIVIYAGNFGIAQNLEILLKAAELLINENIDFILIGAGPEEKKLKAVSESLKLKNLRFLGEVKKEIISHYLYHSDCGVIPLKKIDIFKGTIPSKIFDYMNADLPILLGVEGEAADIITAAGTGLLFEPDNAHDLAEKILWMKNNREKIREMGRKGKDYVHKNFNRQKQAERIEYTLSELLRE